MAEKIVEKVAEKAADEKLLDSKLLEPINILQPKVMEAQIAEKIDVLKDNMPLMIHLGVQLLTAIVILIAGYTIGNWLSGKIANVKKIDKTLRSFLAGLVKYAILAVAVVTILGQLGVQTASLLAVMGAAGLAIGLALQGTLSNVAASVMMLVLRPFDVGDYITTDNIGGTVVSLGLFGTELATPDNVYIFVPNSKIWNNNIFNYSRNPKRRQDLVVGIGYNDEIGKALDIVGEVINADARVLQEPDEDRPQVMVSNMGDFAVNITARFWCNREDYWSLKWDLNRALKEALDQGGISIPSPAWPSSAKKAAS